MEALLAKSPLGEKSKPELVGYRSAGSSKLFEKPLMKFLDIVTVGKSECKRTFEGIFKLQENQICTHKTCKTNIVPKIVSTFKTFKLIINYHLNFINDFKSISRETF